MTAPTRRRRPRPLSGALAATAEANAAPAATEQDYRRQVGRRLFVQRVWHNLSQAELAAKAGVTPQLRLQRRARHRPPRRLATTAARPRRRRTHCLASRGPHPRTGAGAAPAQPHGVRSRTRARGPPNPRSAPHSTVLEMHAQRALLIAARHASTNGGPERLRTRIVPAEAVPVQARVLGAERRQPSRCHTAPLVPRHRVRMLHPAQPAPPTHPMVDREDQPLVEAVTAVEQVRRPLTPARPLPGDRVLPRCIQHRHHRPHGTATQPTPGQPAEHSPPRLPTPNPPHPIDRLQGKKARGTRIIRVGRHHTILTQNPRPPPRAGPSAPAREPTPVRGRTRQAGPGDPRRTAATAADGCVSRLPR